MKKTLILSAIMLLTTLGACAYDFTPVNDNQIIQYSPVLKTWSDGIMNPDENIAFMKKMTFGTGGDF